MSDYNPEAPVRLKFSNRDVELFRDRTIAFTHRELGHRALNHLWVSETDESGREYGFYIWHDQFGTNEEERTDFFNQTIQAMANYGYYLILNRPEPAEVDVNAFIEKEARDLDNGWD